MAFVAPAMLLPWHMTHLRLTTASPPLSAVAAARLVGSTSPPPSSLLLLLHALRAVAARAMPTNAIPKRCQVIAASSKRKNASPSGGQWRLSHRTTCLYVGPRR